MIIAVDGGTTNTRLRVVDDGDVLHERMLSLGIRDTLSDGSKVLSDAIRDAIAEITKEYPDCEAAVFSGMIGSETGLLNVAHKLSPIGARGIADSMTQHQMPEITNLPTYFIPGIKTIHDCPTYESIEIGAALRDADIMRGEETELFGIMEAIGIKSPSVFILPGSHFKYITTDTRGRIASFYTTLTGELLRATAENTILKASLEALPTEPDEAMLCCGYEFAEAHGISVAAFKVRVLNKTFGVKKSDLLFSFLLGAMLHDDIKSVASTTLPIYIGGSRLFKRAIELILKKQATSASVTALDKTLSNNASAIGAELLYKLRCSNY